ncbi:hypothetical protein [Streptomyces sp. NPDC054842]
MGRSSAVPAGLLVLLLTAGCSGTGKGDGAEPAPHGAQSSTESSSGSETDDRPSGTPSAFELPAGAKVLVPTTQGTGDADLPAFKPETDVYTVYATCTGGGSMSIAHRDAPQEDATRIRCGGPETIGQVYTDSVTEKLSVQTKGAVNWTLAVVSGKYDV